MKIIGDFISFKKMSFSSSEDLNTTSLQFPVEKKITSFSYVGSLHTPHPPRLSFRISCSLRKIFNSLYSVTRRDESRLSV